MVELGLGRLRYWLLPSHWTRLFALMQYEQSCVNERKVFNKLPIVRVKIPEFQSMKNEGNEPNNINISQESVKESLPEGAMNISENQLHSGDPSGAGIIDDTSGAAIITENVFAQEVEASSQGLCRRLVNVGAVKNLKEGWSRIRMGMDIDDAALKP